MSAIVERLKQIANHRVVRNAALMYVVQLSSYLFPLLTLPYLARVLSPAKFGLIAFAQMFIWYFVILTEYGFNLTATREVAVWREDLRRVNRIFSAVMSAKLMLTALGLMMLVGSVLAVEKLRPDLDIYLISFLGVIGNALFPLWLYQGMEKMGRVAMRDFLTKLLALLVLFVFVRGDEDYLVAAGAQSGAMLISAMAGLWQARGMGIRFEMPSWPEVSEAFRTGWLPFAGLAVVSSAGISNIVVLGFWSSPIEVAYYSGAQRIIAAFRGLVAPVSSALYPYASQKAADSERSVMDFVRRYQWILMAPFVLCGVVMLVGGPVLMPWFLGSKYASSVLPLQIMALIPALFSLSLIYSTYYMLACGYDKEWMRITMIVTVVNLALMFALLMTMRGSLAIAWTGLLTELLGAALYWWFFHKRSRQMRDNAVEVA